MSLYWEFLRSQGNKTMTVEQHAKHLRVKVCENCGKTFDVSPKVTHIMYCSDCRAIKSKERKYTYYLKNKDDPDYKKKASDLAKISMPRRVSKIVKRGEQISSLYTKSNLAWEEELPLPNFNIQFSFKLPFDWALSKNARVNFGNGRHWVNQHVRDAEFAVEKMIKEQDIKWQQNKLYISIFIEKPNMRGDAVNFVDSICDGVKKATGVDDRWFSLKRVDWQIKKVDPFIYVSLYQDTTTKVQACSHCGRILPLSEFYHSKYHKAGVGRECKLCTSTRKPV